VPLLVGDVIHRAAAEVLAAVRARRAPPAYEALVATARGTLNHVWRNSQPDLIDRFWRWPGVHPAFREVLYRGALRAAEIDQARWVLASCIRHLLAAPVLEDVRRCAASEVWLPEPGPSSFHLPLAPGEREAPVQGPAPSAQPSGDREGDGGALTVWAGLDAAYVHTERGAADGGSASGLPVGTRCWCVVDWKTGAAREAEERLQVATYALWLQAWGRPPTDGVYLGRVVGLRDARERWYVVGPAERAAARAVMAEDTRRLLARMADVDRALPRPKADWALAAERGTCAACRYLALCRDDLRPLRDRAALLRRASVPSGPDAGEDRNAGANPDPGR
jgi:hypothetical protein